MDKVISEQIRQNREDYRENRQRVRETLQSDIDAYLAAGNKITIIDPTASGMDWSGKRNVHWWSGAHSQEEITRRQKAGKKRLGIKAG